MPEYMATICKQALVRLTGEVDEARRREAHLALDVAQGRVESRRDHQQLGGEVTQDGHDDQVEGGRVVRVPEAGLRPRYVDGTAASVALADLQKLPGPREEASAAPV